MLIGVVAAFVEALSEHLRTADFIAPVTDEERLRYVSDSLAVLLSVLNSDHRRLPASSGLSDSRFAATGSHVPTVIRM